MEERKPTDFNMKLIQVLGAVEVSVQFSGVTDNIGGWIPKTRLFFVGRFTTADQGCCTRYYVTMYIQTQNHVSSWSYVPPVQLWNSFNMYRIRNTELVDFSLELWIMDDVSRAITKVATLWGERRGAVLWIQHLWSSHCGWYFCFGSAFQI